MAAVVVLAVVVAGYVYGWQRGRTELEASRALMALRALPARSGEAPTATSGEFLKVASDWASTSSGERALLLAAGKLYEEGKYAEAQAQFERFGSAYASSSLASIAALGVAVCLDAQDRIDPALSAYQGVVTRFGSDPATHRAKLAMANLHQAKNQPAQALKLLEELSKDTAAGQLAVEAGSRQRRLLLEHPELAPANPAAAGATNLVSAVSGAETNPAVVLPALTNATELTNSASATNASAPTNGVLSSPTPPSSSPAGALEPAAPTQPPTAPETPATAPPASAPPPTTEPVAAPPATPPPSDSTPPPTPPE